MRIPRIFIGRRTYPLASPLPTMSSVSPSSLLHRRKQVQTRQQQKQNSINHQQQHRYRSTIELDEKIEEKEKGEREEKEEKEELQGTQQLVQSAADTTASSISSSSSSTSLAQIRLRPGHEYNQLPADLIYLISQHLDGRSLARLGSCDLTSQIVSAKPQLWECLTKNTSLQAEWLDVPGLIASSETAQARLEQEMEKYISKRMGEYMSALFEALKNFDIASLPSHADYDLYTRQHYLTRYQLVMKLRRYASDKWKQRCLEQQGRWRVKLMDLLEEVLMRPFLIALVGWQLFLIIRALDAASPPCLHISTFLPLLLATFLILASFLNLFYIKWRSSTCHTPNQQHTINASSTLTLPDVDTSWHFLPASYISRSQSGIARTSHAVVLGYLGNSSWKSFRSHSLLIMIVLMLALFAVLFVLRVTSTLSLHWMFIFLPFYLAFLFLQVGCYRLDWDPYVDIHMNGTHMAWSLTIIIHVLTVFAAAINLCLVYHEMYDRTFHYILFPIYFLFTGATIEWSWQCIKSHGRAFSAKRIGFPLWLMGVLPMARTVISIGQKMDGYEQSNLIGFGIQIDLTWRNILMPLWIPLTCLFVRFLLRAKADLRHQQFESATFDLRNPHLEFDIPTEVRSNK